MQHGPGWVGLFSGAPEPAQAALPCQGTSVPLTWQVVMESRIQLCSVQFCFVEHKACFNVLLLSAVRGVFLECQTRMAILGISGKS